MIFHDLLLESALFACIIMQLQSNTPKKYRSRLDGKQYLIATILGTVYNQVSSYVPCSKVAIPLGSTVRQCSNNLALEARD